MSRSPLVRPAVLRSVPSLLEERGINPVPSLARAGLSADIDSWSQTVISQRQGLTLLETAMQVTGERHFPALLGGRIMADLGVVREVVMRSANLGQAVRAGSRALGVVRQGAAFTAEETGGFGIVTHHIADVSPDEAFVLGQMSLLAVCSIMRNRCDPSWSPHAVVLAQGTLRPDGALEDLFGAPVFVRPGRSRLIVLAEDLSRAFAPVPGRPPATSMPAVGFVRSDDELARQLERIVEGMLSLGDLSFDGAAHTLGLPPRSLQDRLARMGETFSHLVEQRRRTLAAHYLARSSLGVAEIAMLLGYGDASNFTRAFRRWHGGVTPRLFRSRARAEGQE